MAKGDIGLIGLAMMGQNLALNICDHGFHIVVHNRTTEKVDAFLKESGKDSNLSGAFSLKELCENLQSPRKIMFMVKAGHPVDELIDSLLPHLNAGDILIDGGNSLYTDTERRVTDLAKKNILYVGMGVSGGEEGARHGPSLMPGGNVDAWPHIQPIFQAIAAKVGDDVCCDWIGTGGAGHYVKMVHNGIEYGDMQLICEAYQVLRQGLGLSVDALQNTFNQWQEGVLDSYLIEITRDILKVKDTDGKPLVDKILDSAGQKGTGKWTGINALETGIPLTLIGEAVFARYLSALKEQRVQASKILTGPTNSVNKNQQDYSQFVHDALYASKIISYAQGFMLMQQAAKTYEWQLNYGNIALVWRGGCIIRSRFLGNIKQAFSNNPALQNLLLDSFFKDAITTAQPGWRKTLQFAIESGIPTPAFSSALAFYDGYRSEVVPANLLQAQRDYFGAHTYERIDQPRGKFFHTQWQQELTGK